MERKGIACPNCEGTLDRVIDSRPRNAGRIYRRRVCSDCDYRASTVELTKEELDELTLEADAYWRIRQGLDLMGSVESLREFI